MGVLWNPSNPERVSEVRELQSAAQTLGVHLDSVELQGPEELEDAFAAAQGRVGALIVMRDGHTVGQEPRIAALALESRLPSMYDQRSYVVTGGLMAYGAKGGEGLRRVTDYVDRIFKGANPADLPVEQPREFDFAINLKTAQALGLTIPQSLLLQATEVIQ